jgi:Lrp/AsnC family leucine-responsive transcriptional regulator
MSLDRSERVILRALQKDGRLSNVELARAAGLSESPCFRRVRRLEERGVIRGYTALVDPHQLGYSVTAFVNVRLDKSRHADTPAFLARVSAEDHIVECHATSGAHDYLLKVIAHSIEHFSELCLERILKYPGVSNVESAFSLREIKCSRTVPVP